MVANMLEAVTEGGEVLWGRHVGHLRLVDEARPLLEVERALQVEDRPAVLDGHYPPGRERAAIADTVHFVEDGRPWVARAQEVRVQRMHATGLHGPPGRDERLSSNLSPEYALAGLIEVLASKDVHFDYLEVEQLDEMV
jgi:hypothetical protein